MFKTIIGMKEFLFNQIYDARAWYWLLFTSFFFACLSSSIFFLIGSLWTEKENRDRDLDGVSRARNNAFVYFRYFLVWDAILVIILYAAYTN